MCRQDVFSTITLFFIFSLIQTLYAVSGSTLEVSFCSSGRIDHAAAVSLPVCLYGLGFLARARLSFCSFFLSSKLLLPDYDLNKISIRQQRDLEEGDLVRTNLGCYLTRHAIPAVLSACYSKRNLYKGSNRATRQVGLVRYRCQCLNSECRRVPGYQV